MVLFAKLLPGTVHTCSGRYCSSRAVFIGCEFVRMIHFETVFSETVVFGMLQFTMLLENETFFGKRSLTKNLRASTAMRLFFCTWLEVSLMVGNINYLWLPVYLPVCITFRYIH